MIDIRQERLESLGVRFLRFTDVDVKRNMEMVLNSIASGTLRERAVDRQIESVSGGVDRKSLT